MKRSKNRRSNMKKVDQNIEFPININIPHYVQQPIIINCRHRAS